MIEEIKTENNPFKGAEWIAEMNSGEIISKMKDMTFMFRTKGGRKTSIETQIVQRRNTNNEWYDYELRTPICRIIEGTDMSNYRPIIGGKEYTWGELKRLPKELLQVKLYMYHLTNQKYGEQE